MGTYETKIEVCLHSLISRVLLLICVLYLHELVCMKHTLKLCDNVANCKSHIVGVISTGGFTKGLTQYVMMKLRRKAA